MASMSPKDGTATTAYVTEWAVGLHITWGSIMYLSVALGYMAAVTLQPKDNKKGRIMVRSYTIPALDVGSR